jgi:biotin carboxyl carrier protein
VKRLRITVNGISYEVEVEVLEDDDEMSPPYRPAVPNLPSPMSAALRAPAPAAGEVQQSRQPAAAPAAAPAPAAASGGGSHTLTSPIAGIVVEVRASVGAAVQENEPLLILEAMKMNTTVSSPVAGKIKAILVKAGDSVQQGQVLLEYE